MLLADQLFIFIVDANYCAPTVSDPCGCLLSSDYYTPTVDGPCGCLYETILRSRRIVVVYVAIPIGTQQA